MIKFTTQELETESNLKQHNKNRKPSSKNMTKNNYSGSTSLSNNAIQNTKQLSRVDKHNYHKYDNNSELVEIIKGTINNLKKAQIIKNTYTISESDRNKIIEYVDKVQDTNKDFKKTKMLSVTLINVDTELQDNREKIKILTKNNKALSLKVDTLSKSIDNKNKEIKELKQDNKHLQEMVEYFKNLFSRLVKFIKNKMFGKDKEREDY